MKQTGLTPKSLRPKTKHDSSLQGERVQKIPNCLVLDQCCPSLFRLIARQNRKCWEIDAAFRNVEVVIVYNMPPSSPSSLEWGQVYRMLTCRPRVPVAPTTSTVFFFTSVSPARPTVPNASCRLLSDARTCRPALRSRRCCLLEAPAQKSM